MSQGDIIYTAEYIKGVKVSENGEKLATVNEEGEIVEVFISTDKGGVIKTEEYIDGVKVSESGKLVESTLAVTRLTGKVGNHRKGLLNIDSHTK